MEGVFIILIVFFSFFALCGFGVLLDYFVLDRQKAHNNSQRRVYAGRTTTAAPAAHAQEPTIYVSPANLAPPPKYELMAPPSYEEVIGMSYPYNSQGQPIAQPIAQPLSFPPVANPSTDVAPVHSPPNYRTAIESTANNVTVVSVNERRLSAPATSS